MAASTTSAPVAEFAAKPQGMAAYAAPSLFQPHNARQAIRDAHAGRIPPLLGAGHNVTSIPIARILAPMGFDAIWIDWEHTATNIETMTTVVHEIMFMSGGRTIPFVRVPGHEHASIGYALDAGASIIVPQVNTVEECKHVIAATNYGAKIGGTRSTPPMRLLFGVCDTPMIGNDLHKSLNEQAAVMIQIETLEAINNLDAMLTECPDVDMVWLGSLDCRVSMGLGANFFGGTELEWLAAEQKFIDTLRKHNKPRGGFAFGAAALPTIREKGFAAVWYDGDVIRLLSMPADLAKARELVAIKDKGEGGEGGAEVAGGKDIA